MSWTLFIGHYFAWFEGLGPKSRSLWIYQPTAINQKPIINEFMILYSFQGVHWEENDKHFLLKINRSPWISIFNLKGLELIISLHNRLENEFEILVISCANIWPNLILVLPRILEKQSNMWLQIYSYIYDDVTDFEVCRFIKTTII